MASAGRVQTLLACAKAQERHAMLPDGYSVGCFRLGTRLLATSLSTIGSWAELQNAAHFIIQAAELKTWYRRWSTPKLLLPFWTQSLSRFPTYIYKVLMKVKFEFVNHVMCAKPSACGDKKPHIVFRWMTKSVGTYIAATTTQMKE